MTAALSTDPSTTPASDPARAGVVVAILAAAGIAVSLAQTLVVPILGSLPQIFHTSASTAAWIITATLLTGAISTPIMGRLGDMYGKKRMMLVALLPFLVGSIVCAVAVSPITMIAGRGLQGVASGVIPLGISLLHDVLPKEKVGGAIALMSSSLGIGGALGLPVAAAVTQFASWRVLFWVIAIITVAVGLGILALIPAPGAKGVASKFDYIGALGLMVGLTALLLAVSKGADWGWGSPITLGLLVLAVAVLLLWGRYETGRTSPLVDLRTTAKPVVLLTNLASILFGFTMYSLNLVLPRVIQLPVEVGYGLGQTMLQMGLWLAPMGIGMMAVSNLGASISRRRSPKVTLTAAGLVIAVGYGIAALVLATIGSRAPGEAAGSAITWTLVLTTLGATVTGCGIGLAYGAMPALIMSAVPAHEKAAANGFNALMRSLGTTVSSAVMGLVLAVMVQEVGGREIPTHAGLLVGLLIGCVAALVAAGVSAAIPDRSRAIKTH